jgi:hypothetical protein
MDVDQCVQNSIYRTGPAARGFAFRARVHASQVDKRLEAEEKLKKIRAKKERKDLHL